MKIRKLYEDLNDIKKFSQEEDWEEHEENDEYIFLKNLQTFLNKKSFPKKSTRKFLRMAYELVDQGEISKETLDDYINQEGINSDIVDEIRLKTRKKNKDSASLRGYVDPCGGSSVPWNPGC